jgi:hypothetical protein
VTVPSYEVLEDLGYGRKLVRFTDGPQSGTEVVLISRPVPGVRSIRERRDPAPPSPSAEERAEALLVSLLTDAQRADWERRRRFMVGTPHGELEFGDLNDIRFFPTPANEYRLCVLPKGSTRLPACDIWANLLLFVRHDPNWFFTVANWCRPGGEWNFGPVPGIKRRRG